MDSDPIRERRRKKKAASKEAPPMKVVYISNPMKLNASASNFRSLVQELTGQHSVWPVDPSKYAAEISESAEVEAETGNGNSGGTAEGSAGSSDPYPQPLDQDDDDRVVLIDRHMFHYMLDDHQCFAGVDSGSSRKQL